MGADKVIDNWIAELWPALENLIRPGSISGRKKDMEKSSLTLPSCPPVSLNLEWREEPSPAIENQDLINPPAPYPLIEGDPVEVTLSNARVLTKQGALKTTLELTLSFKEVCMHNIITMVNKFNTNHITNHLTFNIGLICVDRNHSNSNQEMP